VTEGDFHHTLFGITLDARKTRVLTKFRGSKITKTFCHFSGKPSTTRQSVSEEYRGHKVDVLEILPPFGRLNDI